MTDDDDDGERISGERPETPKTTTKRPEISISTLKQIIMNMCTNDANEWLNVHGDSEPKR
jgi:hypothetical protein